jgi:hypothetical protein
MIPWLFHPSQAIPNQFLLILNLAAIRGAKKEAYMSGYS